MEIMPEDRVPFNYFIIPIADAYYRAGAPKKANKILEQLAMDQEDELHYYLSLTGDYANSVAYEKKIAMYVLQEIVRITQNYGQKELNDKINKDFQQLFMSYRKSPSLNENE
jgi:DNA-directed RNA polymerase subunit F